MSSGAPSIAHLLRGRPMWVSIPRPVRIMVGVAGCGLLYLLPMLVVPVLDTAGSDFASVLFYPVGIYVLLAIGLNVLVGMTGLINVGYAGFFAIGGYVMAVLGTQLQWSYYVITPVAAIVGAFAGLLLGIPAIRLRGDYLAIVTLGFGEIVQEIAKNVEHLGGPSGINAIPHPGGIGPLTFGYLDPRPYGWLLITIILVVLLVVRLLDRSRVGRAWNATREDEDAAEFMGVPTFRFKLLALALSSAIGSIAGTSYAAKVGFISPDNFPLLLSVLVLAAVILGGAGSIAGVVAGAVLVGYLPERFRVFSDYRVLLFSAAVVILMIWRPQGLFARRGRRPADVDAEPESA
ncbi:branched-chain amino acid ABC transporter permease [Pseudonocardia acidicola]|nr:branched-chain amino acid ABC transporter permease [Pseudonocardia acidicola]